jgi:hypothetical protein
MVYPNNQFFREARLNQINRRSVLKVAVQGRTCRYPGQRHGLERDRHVVGTRVVEVRLGVVESSGLLKVDLVAGRIRVPRVRTLYGGNVWVIRALTSGELVAAWDDPEN